MEREVFVTDPIQFDADPAARPDIGWFEVRIGLRLYERRLKTGWYGKPYCDVTIIVMVVGEHDKNLILHKEGGLAVRKSFAHFRKFGTEPADALQLLFTHHHFSLS